MFVSGGLDAGALVNQGITPQGLLEVHFNVEGRGNDMPNNLRSEGAEDYNGFLHQDDLKSVVEYTLRLPNVQRNNVGIISFSYGVTMAAGMLARYPYLEVKYFIDVEGPIDCFDTLFYYSESQEKKKTVLSLFGGHNCDDTKFWSERQAILFLPKVTARYMRVQAEIDHFEDLGYYAHAIKAMNAVTNVSSGGKGQSPWTRVNGSENRVNVIYDSNKSSEYPRWLPGKLTHHRETIRGCILEMSEMPPI